MKLQTCRPELCKTVIKASLAYLLVVSPILSALRDSCICFVTPSQAVSVEAARQGLLSDALVRNSQLL